MSAPIAETLRRTPLFANLPPDDLARVAGISSVRRCGKKEALFREGDRADGFFIVSSGRIKVFKLSPEGKEQVLHVIEPGQSFAEATIFEGGHFPASAEALADSETVFIPKKPFIDLLEKTPRIALRMLGSMSKWLKRMTDLVESLALRDVETRLVVFVSEELKSRGTPLADGAVLELEVTKNVLASRLGTVPETFSRTLRKLQEEGKIRVRGRQIRVMSANRLFASLDR